MRPLALNIGDIIKYIIEEDYCVDPNSTETVRKDNHGKGMVSADITGVILSKFYNTNYGDILQGYSDILTGGKITAKYPGKLINQGNYFGALSAFFDNLCAERNTMAPDEYIRQELVDFVLLHFPNELPMPDFTLYSAG